MTSAVPPGRGSFCIATQEAPSVAGLHGDHARARVARGSVSLRFGRAKPGTRGSASLHAQERLPNARFLFQARSRGARCSPLRRVET